MSNGPLVTGSAMRRCAVVILFVALWMACGWLWKMESNAYLLLGIPLTVLCRLLVRRQSLRALWVRDAPRFRLGWKGLLIAVGFSVIPLFELLSAAEAADIIGVLFSLASVVGAFAAAYAAR